MTYPQITPKISLSTWYTGQNEKNIEEQIRQILIDQLDVTEKEDFLHPSLKHIHDPLLLKDMEKGVDLFLHHWENQGKIVVVGDYDVDGITATALFGRFMRKIDYRNFDTFIPNRFHHGYGLTEKSVREIAAMQPDLVITVDNGITAAQEIELLMQRDIDVIVTDHHMPLSGNTPQCTIINPKQVDCNYPNKNLAGVGVAFLFLIALRTKLRERGYWTDRKPEPNLAEELDLVAMGTLADQVPLHGVNRVFVYHGLRQIKHFLEGLSKPVYPYLKAFFQEQVIDSVDAETLVFQLIPRLNAPGRMEDAAESLTFLLAEKDEIAFDAYRNLQSYNNDRRQKSESMFETAVEMMAHFTGKEKSIVLFDESFHEGILGIVASQLVEKYHLPTILFSKSGEILKGSGRSLPNIDLLDILGECSLYMDRFGGHSAAAGCTMPIDKFHAFRARFEQACVQHTHENGVEAIQADLEVQPWMVTTALPRYLSVLEPHGYENQKPIFVFRDFQLPPFRIIAKKHLKWKLASKLEMIFWNGVSAKPKNELCDIAFTLRENSFLGLNTTQLIVKAITPSFNN